MTSSVREFSYKLEWMETRGSDVDAAGEWLLDLSIRLQPDLIHLNNYAHGDLEWHAPVVDGRPLVCLLLVARRARRPASAAWNGISSASPGRPASARHGRWRLDDPCCVNWSVGTAVFVASCVIYNGQRAGHTSRACEGRFRVQHGPGLGCGEKHRSARSAAPHVMHGPYTWRATHSIPDGGRRSLLRIVHPIGQAVRPGHPAVVRARRHLCASRRVRAVRTVRSRSGLVRVRAGSGRYPEPCARSGVTRRCSFPRPTTKRSRCASIFS